MIQEHFFPVFQLFALEVKHFYRKNTWKDSQMHIQSTENDFEHEIPLTKNLLWAKFQLCTSLELSFIYRSLQNYVWLFIE